MATDDKPKQPSVKHALDDVLQSLQDLVRNELSKESQPPAKASPPIATPPSPAQPIPVLTDLVQSIPVSHKTTKAPRGVQGELPLDAASATATPEDIPVLQNVVVPSVRPTSARARTVAIDLVARIDGLLREAGKPALDPAMIARLEQLLRDALEAWAAGPPKPR